MNHRGVTLLALLLVALLLPAPTTGPAAGAPGEGRPAPSVLAAVESSLATTPGAHAHRDEQDLTLALRDLWLSRSALAATDRRRARGLLARPSDPHAPEAWRYPGELTPRRSCTARLCVTHVETGRHAAAPAWASATLTAVEAAWTRLVEQLGYRAPAPDGSAGGDARFDVYLADLSSQGELYGFCAPEELAPGHHARATAFCVLDNDMAQLGASPSDALAATAAHEFFHAVQFNYDVGEDRWFMEASATWAEAQVFARVRDNRQFLAQGQVGRPTLPLDSVTSSYGNWIFVQFLAQRGGIDAVRQIWERLDASPGARDEWSVQGVGRHFAARGDAWPRLYADFVRANFRPARHYTGGASFPRAAVTARAHVGRRTPSVRRAAWLPHLSSHSLRLRVGARDRSQRLLRLDLRTTRRQHARIQVLVHRKDGRVGLRRVPVGRAGRAVVRVNVRGGRVRHVVVLTSHSGAAHRNCGGNSGWSCGGDPVGALRVRLRARLLP
ncbi:hypothetical protein IEQ44_02780 [Nocardioides sp. Y6]|uniref:Neutral metalloprotease n=1 Tax=Nocardioides malaquae TaxID=2773426 RepID=A0ABR9RPS8_9ACTN|nr:MXAN_6640 family putative metalloprotease [Nocardioides malaquae]MBE7323577.1 hypothetical protein [Nocardioides malaquae]